MPRENIIDGVVIIEEPSSCGDLISGSIMLGLVNLSMSSDTPIVDKTSGTAYKHNTSHGAVLDEPVHLCEATLGFEGGARMTPEFDFKSIVDML